MTYNEFETKSLGKLKILAHIDNRALLEKMYNTPEKYIIATNFNIETKSWDFGSYFENFQDALEEFTERVLSNKHLKSSKMVKWELKSACFMLFQSEIKLIIVYFDNLFSKHRVCQ